jgi:hypothetical protein
LLDWAEVESAYNWRALLLGNGLSINVWRGFEYRSLYREARRLGDAVLTAEDQALFKALGTENFERVLGDLSTGMRVTGALNRPTGALIRRYRSIQAALGEAIRAVHIPWPAVPATALSAIQTHVHRYEWVFTTSYDLLVYWAMGHNEDYGRLVDCFWGPNCSFDPGDTDIRARSIPVLFLHGAMHLIVESSGRTRKLRRNATLTLLDLFGEPIPGDPGARPLLVTEGSWRHKLQAIESNAYLGSVFETFRGRNLNVPLVVFGASLSEQDRHLTDAISAYPDRPVAVSLRPADTRSVRARQADIYGRVEGKPVLFFDSTTHPLGRDELAVELASSSRPTPRLR